MREGAGPRHLTRRRHTGGGVRTYGGANRARNTNATRARTIENALAARSAQPPADLIGADTQCTSIRFPTNSPRELRISPRSRPHPDPRPSVPVPFPSSRRRVVAFCSFTAPLLRCIRDLGRPSRSLRLALARPFLRPVASPNAIGAALFAGSAFVNKAIAGDDVRSSARCNFFGVRAAARTRNRIPRTTISLPPAFPLADDYDVRRLSGRHVPTIAVTGDTRTETLDFDRE